MVSKAEVTRRVLGDDPLSSDGVLRRTFYRTVTTTEDPREKAEERGVREPHGDLRRPPARVDVEEKAKPTHYKVISISLYTEDIERLERMVAELKRRGHTKVNKSQLIRFALDTVDLDAVPRSY